MDLQPSCCYYCCCSYSTTVLLLASSSALSERCSFSNYASSLAVNPIAAFRRLRRRPPRRSFYSCSAFSDAEPAGECSSLATAEECSSARAAEPQ